MGCMMYHTLKRIVIGICSILMVSLSTVIIVVTATRLHNASLVGPNGEPIDYEVNCLITGESNGANLCNYTFAVCGISMLVYCGTALFLCLTCNLCGIGAWLESLLHLFQIIWWIAASVVITKSVKDTDDAGWPREADRHAVAILAWISALVAFVMLCFTLVEAAQSCLECCGLCQSSKDGDTINVGGKSRDKEQATQQQPAQPPQPPQQMGGWPQGVTRGQDPGVKATAV